MCAGCPFWDDYLGKRSRSYWQERLGRWSWEQDVMCAGVMGAEKIWTGDHLDRDLVDKGVDMDRR